MDVRVGGGNEAEPRVRGGADVPVDVARRVEEKVLHFPTARMEDIVRRVTDRELRLIVRLGYLLGAIIGLMMVGVDALIR